MSGVSRRLTSKHTGPAVKRDVRHCPGQKPHRRSRSGWVTSAGLESVGHEVEEAEGDRADEGAPVHHSMIWSARTRMDCGIVRPSALYSSERSPAQETKRRREKRSRGGPTWRPGAC